MSQRLLHPVPIANRHAHSPLGISVVAVVAPVIHALLS